MKTSYRGKRFVKGRDRTIGDYKRFSGPGVTRPEKKFLDIDILDNPIGTTAGVISSLNILPQGIAANERIGRKVTITKLKIKYRIHMPLTESVSTLTSGDTVRVMIFIDKQANGAAALGTDILSDDTDYHSYRLLSNAGRFTVLWDRTDHLDFANFVYDSNVPQVMQTGGAYYIKFSKNLNLPIEFNGATGAITEIRSNNIGMLLMSSNGRAVMKGISRIRYADN